jgi:hypothetical protein
MTTPEGHPACPGIARNLKAWRSGSLDWSLFPPGFCSRGF